MPQTYLSETIHAVQGKAPVADFFNGDPESDLVSLKDYSQVTFILSIGVGATGTATLTVNASQDNAGAGAVAIPFKYRRVANTATSDVETTLTDADAAGFTTTAGSNQVYIVEVDASALPEGNPFASLQCTEAVDSPVVASLVCLLSGARYKSDTHLTAIA